MSHPYFSIVVPVYNAFDTLTRSVAGVINQTDADWELILIDDGSTDKSLPLMLSFAGEDERIRVVSRPNRGPSAARNFGAGLARGRMLAFLDADDFWMPEKLAAHRAFHGANPSLAASFARTQFVRSHPDRPAIVQAASHVPEGTLDLGQVMAENPVCTMSNLVIRREVFENLGGLAPSFVHAEDQQFLARLVDAGHPIAGMAAPLVQYATSPDGLSADLAAMLEGWRALARPYADRIDLRAAEAVYCRYLARRALRTGAHGRLAWSFMLEGLRIDAAAFLADRRRGALTMIGALAGLCLPGTVSRRIFA